MSIFLRAAADMVCLAEEKLVFGAATNRRFISLAREG
jgi:hypothetical protein